MSVDLTGIRAIGVVLEQPGCERELLLACYCMHPNGWRVWRILEVG